ncbi:MarR family winged helix-turn-helix transcriptional regulator [Frankia sp. AgKG'84/4]|uniref:MarR family winged helix-turn-helix transcriptional regulator n=1 Tax=Frankia sp. AgKG'84/4 TaxID=573490 RepID=UPI00200F1543|nr:MarR family transcriptional regulator [Frankia sp. AgKG'84/4]MCL9793192.1 MarR family transcriptional regulator [Frankia sp. AgKG'84/4]
MDLVRKARRAELIDVVATTLLGRASRLTRLLMRSGTRELTRTEIGLLATVADGPCSITALAETEALAQPSVSRLVDRLAAQGLVARGRDGADGRMVLVSISEGGREQLGTAVDHLRSLLRSAVAELSDEDLEALARASEILDGLAGSLGRAQVPA